MIGKNRIIRFLLFFAFCILAGEVHAGWILTGRYIDQDGKTIMQRYYFQGDNVKFERFNLIYSLNLKTGSLVLVDPENLVFYQGTLDDYIAGLKNDKQKNLDILLRDIPREQQEEYKRLYNNQISSIGRPLSAVTDSVSCARMNDTLKVGGYHTEKYQVILKGQKVEETWIAIGLNISTLTDWNRYLSVVNILEPWNTATLGYMLSSPYQQLLQKGYPVRRIMIQGGYRSEFQVNKIEEKEVPEYEFYTPALCRQISLEKWIERSRKAEPQYDDYE